MVSSLRCLYENDIASFIVRDKEAILGALCESYHGNALTTTRDAWIKEIDVMQATLLPWENIAGRIIFEYDIPRLGKRVDVVLLIEGIIFCLEFKAGESKILEADIDQVLDYALDLKNFHKFSQTSLIVPILVATECGKA